MGVGALYAIMRDPHTSPSRLCTATSLHHRAKGARFARAISIFALGWVFCASGYAQDRLCKVVPAGQDFWIRLTKGVSTYSSKRGEVIEAILIASPTCGDSVVFSRGTPVEGRVTYVRRVGLGFWHGSSAITIDFDKLFVDSTSFSVKTRVEEVANGRESVKRGVIEGVGGQQTPQELMSTRLLHLPFWNPDSYWIYLVRRGAFPISPEPEIHLPAGTDLRLRLMASIGVPAELVKERQEEKRQADTEIDNDLREKLLALPNRSLTRSGRPSDVVNLAFLGSPEQIEAAFQAAGWTYGDSISAWSVLREMRAFSTLNSYAHLPISNQWLDGKAPDIRLQKSFDSYQKREHIRIWKEDGLEQNLWAAGVIRETSASWSIRTGRFIHHVDPDIDAERESVVRDLTLAGCVGDVYRVPRAENPEKERNASGDWLRTDGGLTVLKLNDCEPSVIAAALAPKSEIPWRPRSRVKRFVRAQTLSIRDIWRSNVIYASVDLSLVVIHSLRHRHDSEYETGANIVGRLAPADKN